MMSIGKKIFDFFFPVDDPRVLDELRGKLDGWLTPERTEELVREYVKIVSTYGRWSGEMFEAYDLITQRYPRMWGC